MQSAPPADSTAKAAARSSQPSSSTDAASVSLAASTPLSSSAEPSSNADETAWSVAPPLSADEEAVYAERVKAQMAGEVVKPFWVSHVHVAYRHSLHSATIITIIKIADSKIVITTAAEHTSSHPLSLDPRLACYQTVPFLTFSYHALSLSV